MGKPVVRSVGYNRDDLDLFVAEYAAKDTRESKYLLRYPTVYIIHSRDEESASIYVGETNDIEQRTIQHLTVDANSRDDWKALAATDSAEMYVIGHEKFNKSLTLDVENKLMHYLLGNENIKQLNNRRTNAQREYYTQEEFDSIFSDIWRSLFRKNKRLFPDEQIIRDSALFKASPFHKLSEEQLRAKDEILRHITLALERDTHGQLILVNGEAGAGKTVLLSSLFYELFSGEGDPEDPFEFQDLDAYLLVNHQEQLIVYKQISLKLGIESANKRERQRVSRPTTFINNQDIEDKVDVVLVDEAHLLWTQGKQSYRGKNMLSDLLDRAKVVVAVFDKNQILATNQYWDQQSLNWLEERVSERIELSNQMRIDASPTTVNWIRAIVDDRELHPLHRDDSYDIRVFDSVLEMHDEIRALASTTERGLSRLISTFDWEYSSQSKPEGYPYWGVDVDGVRIPWNNELGRNHSRSLRKRMNGRAWAEQEHTVEEVGSTFTIQGFDLNYAGVIIGPSVKFRDGSIVFDPEASKNKGATQRRTMTDGSKAYVGEELIKNELNVLLTRGVHGLFIYAVDEPLREALQEAIMGDSE